jgi:hypothetical protein
MPFTYNQLLIEAGLDPKSVRLLRHQTPLTDKRSLLDVWRRDRAIFEDFQSFQDTAKRASFARPYWAIFLGLGMVEPSSPASIKSVNRKR